MSEKEKRELDEIIVRCCITKDDLYMEAECVEEYGEWIHMSLMGYIVRMISVKLRRG